MNFVANQLLLTLFGFTIALLAPSAVECQEIAINSVLDRVIEKAIKAHGGKDLLEKYAAQTLSSKVKFHGAGKPVEYTAKVFFQAPDKYRLEGKGFVFLVIGDQCWSNGKELTPEQTAYQVEQVYVGWLTSRFPLRNKLLDVKLQDELVIHGRPTIGVKIVSKGHKDLKVYFDKETGLAAKIVSKAFSPRDQKEVEQEVFMSDYQTVNGIPVPLKSTTLQGGKLFVESEFTEWKLAEKLDDAVFSKPK